MFRSIWNYLNFDLFVQSNFLDIRLIAVPTFSLQCNKVKIFIEFVPTRVVIWFVDARQNLNVYFQKQIETNARNDEFKSLLKMEITQKICFLLKL